MTDVNSQTAQTAPITWRPDVFGVPVLERSSPFSYTCHACNRCCKNYLIKTSPYEVLQMARHLGVSTTEFIAQYLVDGAFLSHQDDGRCAFSGDQGCTVHPARPLVCRIYPLGLHRHASGTERISHLAPHPQSDGHYGLKGTVDDYLRQQGTAPYEAAADRYQEVLTHLLAVFRQQGEAALKLRVDLLDADLMIGTYFPHAPSAERADPGQAMHLHIAAIEQWISTQANDVAAPEDLP